MAGRMYMTYMSEGVKQDQGLTFASMTMISLLLSKQAMRCSEIASDIVSGNESKKNAIYGCIHSALHSLERYGFVQKNEKNGYKATSKGVNIYTPLLDKYSQSAWNTLTDCRSI